MVDYFNRGALLTNKTGSFSKNTFKNTLFLCFVVALYSCSGLFTKLASNCGFLSFSYIFYLCVTVAILGLYAVLWQVVLKRVPLSTAYMFRSFGLVYSLIIAHFVFDEIILLQNIIGCGFVITGLIIIAQGEDKR